jgi:hypothetical protein
MTFSEIVLIRQFRAAPYWHTCFLMSTPYSSCIIHFSTFASAIAIFFTLIELKPHLYVGAVCCCKLAVFVTQLEAVHERNYKALYKQQQSLRQQQIHISNSTHKYAADTC